MQAPLTAIFLIAEISGGYTLLVPLIFTSAVSYGVTRMFEKYSIYTKRIAASGELLTHEADQAVLTLMKTEGLVETDFKPVRIDATLGELVQVVAKSERNIFPVLDSRHHFQGFVVGLDDIRQDMFQTDLYDTRHVYNYMRTAPEYLTPDESMDSVMRKFEKTGAWNLPVVTQDRIYGGSGRFCVYLQLLPGGGQGGLRPGGVQRRRRNRPQRPHPGPPEPTRGPFRQHLPPGRGVPERPAVVRGVTAPLSSILGFTLADSARAQKPSSGHSTRPA